MNPDTDLESRVAALEAEMERLRPRVERCDREIPSLIASQQEQAERLQAAHDDDYTRLTEAVDKRVGELVTVPRLVEILRKIFLSSPEPKS